MIKVKEANTQFQFIVVLKALEEANAGFINHVLALKFRALMENPTHWTVYNTVEKRYLTDRELEDSY